MSKMDIGFKLIILELLYMLHSSLGHVLVYRYNETVEEFYDLPAQFGPPLPGKGLKVYAVPSEPKDACRLPNKPPQNPTNKLAKYVLVIARLNCTFEEKVRNAQSAGYAAAMIYNVGSDDLEQMSAKNGADIHIPSVFVGETTGNYIIEGYFWESGFYLVINDELPFNINTHLIIPFSILVGFCFIIMIGYMIYKCVTEQRRIRQHRLPKSLLKKIPTLKFTKGLPYETCVICLDEYVEGDKLRILPCQHGYHCVCIDTWLTKNRRVCPICKRKVFPKGESARRSTRRPTSSDSTTDSEADDTTPLLNQNENNSNTANHGTFNSASNNTENLDAGAETGRQRINPFNRLINGDTQNVEQDVQNVTRSIFNIFSFFRFFRRTRQPNQEISSYGIENPINAILESTIESAVAAANLTTMLPTSNNVMNSNLSGSFKDDDENFENDRRTIYEPIDMPTNTTEETTANHTSTISNLASTIPVVVTQSGRETANNSDSVFIQTPSQGGIGVVALPNTSFNHNNINNNSSNTNSSARNSRRRGNLSSLFIV